MIQNNWTLEGKKALVTGGTKGIGRAIVDEFLSLGAEVLAAARTENDIKELLDIGNNKLHGIAADVSAAGGREAIVTAVHEKLGGLDILVNNAGTNIRKPTLETTPDDLHKIISINLESAFELSKAFFEMLKSSRGCIINISSSASMTGISTSTAIYSMSKAGMDQMTKYLAMEWGPHGIRVNSIHPWYIATPLVETVLADEKKKKKILNRTPLGRIGEPREIASAAAFLAMPAASYISGAQIPVDGGFLSSGI
jgi:Tropinone reductase 1